MSFLVIPKSPKIFKKKLQKSDWAPLIFTDMIRLNQIKCHEERRKSGNNMHAIHLLLVYAILGGKLVNTQM